jgi:hypothetical protein
MESGFILDQGYQIQHVSQWVEGTPQKSFWFGIKSDVTLDVASYRCSGCGYLESYAL